MDQTLGHYKIVSELGRGGMGVVYKAYEESLNRYVAIKVLGEHLGHDDNFVKRFVREARAAAALSHPNVIQIYFIGREPSLTAASSSPVSPDPSPGGPGTRHYFVMEYVEGRSVHDLLKEEGALEPLRAARIVQQAASGLAAAHDQGLVHRDIKPANLLVTQGEHLKIADFGLALAPSDAGTRLTATHSLMGTPGYLSPEQCCGEPAGPRSDIYSLGMTFYEMLTGTMPFRGESPLAVLRQILDEDPPPLLEIAPELDPAIASVVERMVAKEPNDRYQSCHELLADLGGIIAGAAGHAGAGPARPAVAGGPPPAPASASMAPTRTGVAPPRSRDGLTAPPLPPPPVAAVGGGAAALASPPPAATPDGGRRWAIIGGMVLMLVVAVSAAGLFLGKTAWKEADRGIAEIAAGDSPATATRNAERSGVESSDDAATAASGNGAAAAVARAAGGAELGSMPAQSQSPSLVPPAVARAPAQSPPQAFDSPLPGGVAPVARPEGPRSSAPVTSGDDPRADGSSASRASAGQAPAAPAARRAPLRDNARVAVVALGEPMLASGAEAALEAQLLRHGVDLYDERGILELRDGGGGAAFAPSALVEIAAERGIDVLVLVEAEPLGERELAPLNQRYDYATTSRLRVDAFLTAAGDGIASGWSERIEYTKLNAEHRASQAMGRVSNELAGEIGTAWRVYRASASQ